MIIHGYLDTHNGNVGYVADLQIIKGGTYADDSRKLETRPWGELINPNAPALTGEVKDLVYMRIGRHSFEYLERLGLDAKRQYKDHYPGLFSTEPTNKEKTA